MTRLTLLEERILIDYVAWLNSHIEAHDAGNPFRYKPEMFDPAESEHGFFRLVKAVVPDASYFAMTVYEVYDGDDGGAAVLTVWSKGDTPIHIVQEFDTLISLVKDDNKVVLPSDRASLR